MPRVKITHVVSFSSEDGVHKADNLLLADGTKKWRCGQSGEKQVTAVLQFEKATKISSVDIGNDGSAFIEVQVGRASDNEDSYRTLLVASSFMSPVESRNDEQNKRNRVRTFASDSLAKDVAKERWDRAKIICTQPFNKHIKYGVSFIVLGAPEEEETVAKPAHINKLGAFRLRDDSDENDVGSVGGGGMSVGSLFARKKDASDAAPTRLSAAAELRSDKTLASIAVESIANSKAPFQPQHQARDKDKDKNGANRKRNSNGGVKLPRRDGVPGESPPRSPSSKPSKPSKDDAPSAKKKPKMAVADPKSADNGKAGPSGSASKAKPKPRATRPFNRLMEGVVFTISGYQNPLRAEIRQKALNMGAKYRPDWDVSCTHLVCAFANTPKFSQVKKGRGKIVKRDWIEKCHADRRRYPWRRLALDPKDGRGDESDEEVFEETEASTTTTTTTKTTAAAPHDDLDTDEEIEQLKKKDVKKEVEEEVKKKVEKEDEEDEDALYNAETDEEKEEDSDDAYNADTDVDDDGDAKCGDLPDLPDFFDGVTFSFDESVASSSKKLLERRIVTAGGTVRKSLGSDVGVMVAGAEWNAHLKAVHAKFPKLVIVKAKYVDNCWKKQARLDAREFAVLKK